MDFRKADFQQVQEDSIVDWTPYSLKANQTNRGDRV